MCLFRGMGRGGAFSDWFHQMWQLEWSWAPVLPETLWHPHKGPWNGFELLKSEDTQDTVDIRASPGMAALTSISILSKLVLVF